VTTRAAPRTKFGDVFGVGEFRTLWLAQVLSVTGDQLARVALTVLIYDRTGSALLAAVAFSASVVPTFIGGLVLSGLADRLPRRRVMIGAELTSAVLVTVMAVPGVPLAVLIMLLFAVTMISALFLAARSAIYPEILDRDQYVLGTAITMTTLLFAQVAGFAIGGVVVGFLGVHASMLADALSFGASALLIRMRVQARPVPEAIPRGASQPLDTTPRGDRRRHAWYSVGGGVMAGLRLVFGDPALRIPMLFGWLCAFYNIPEGVATPLAAAVGGGAVTVGLVLAAQAFGSAVGAVAFSRLVTAVQQVKWTGPLAIAACASLVVFAVRPSLPLALLILAVSGIFGCYQLSANALFVQAAPPAQRSQAFGIAQGGISLCQGAAILMAGAAAQHVAPATVIAVAGAIGALFALALTRTAAARQIAAHRRH